MLSMLTLAAIIATDPSRILWSVSVSPDGQTLVSSGTPSTWIRDPDTLDPTGRDGFIPNGQATAVEFHPGGDLLAITGPPSLTGLADLKNKTFKVVPTDEGARGIDFNAEGSLVAVSENSGALTVWSVETGELRYRDNPEDGKSLTGVSWHPAADLVVTIGEFITIHDLSNDEPAQPIRIRHRPDSKGYCLLLGIDWHPSGEFFTTSDYGNHDTGDHPTIQFRTINGDLITSIERPGTEIRNVRWNRTGDRLAATADALVIMNKDGTVLSESPFEADLWGLAWSPEGKTLYTTNLEGGLTQWISSNETRTRFNAQSSTSAP